MNMKKFQVVQKGDHEIEYSVPYLYVPRRVYPYLLRRHNDIYQKGCGQVFSLALFSPNLKPDVEYSEEFKKIATIATAVRVRRIVLMEELRSHGGKLNNYAALKALCDDKRHRYFERVKILETELTHLCENDPMYPASKFNALFSDDNGWKVILRLFTIAYRKSQKDHARKSMSNDDSIYSSDSDKEDLGELASDSLRTGSIDISPMGSSISDSIIPDQAEVPSNYKDQMYEDTENFETNIVRIWEWLYLWRIIHSVAVRCRLGALLR